MQFGDYITRGTLKIWGSIFHEMYKNAGMIVDVDVDVDVEEIRAQTNNCLYARS